MSSSACISLFYMFVNVKAHLNVFLSLPSRSSFPLAYNYNLIPFILNILYNVTNKIFFACSQTFFTRLTLTLLHYMVLKGEQFFKQLFETGTERFVCFVVQVAIVNATDPDKGKNGTVTYLIDNSTACPFEIQIGKSQWCFISFVIDVITVIIIPMSTLFLQFIIIHTFIENQTLNDIQKKDVTKV